MVNCQKCGVENNEMGLFCAGCGAVLSASKTSEPIVEHPEDAELLNDFGKRVRDNLAPEYTVIREIGRGGMAIVFEAEDNALSRHVALKVLPAEHAHDRTLVDRFQREARMAGALSHPHIVPVHSVGSKEDIHYFSMPYLDGGSLETALKQQMPEVHIARIAKKVASALAYAHRKGVIHRDLKLSNILLDSNQMPYLVDFGIAKALSSTDTTSRGFTGTPHYMSPEQALGENVDARADLYAFGVVFFRMLTGRLPFDGNDAMSIMYKHVNLDPEPPSKINPAINPHWDSVVLKLLAKEPEKRFQRAEDLIIALDTAFPTTTEVDLVSVQSILDAERKRLEEERRQAVQPPAEAPVRENPRPEPPPRATVEPPKAKKHASLLRFFSIAILVAVLIMIGYLGYQFWMEVREDFIDPQPAITEEQGEIGDPNAPAAKKNEKEAEKPQWKIEDPQADDKDSQKKNSN